MHNSICNYNEGIIKNRIFWGGRLGGTRGWPVDTSCAAKFFKQETPFINSHQLIISNSFGFYHDLDRSTIERQG